MNTHDIDIDLPPLPGWMGNCFIHADQYSEHEHEGVWLKDLVTKHVIAAIEADRKRRGEPVFYINRKIVDPVTGKIARHVTDAITWSSEPVAGAWTMPVYAAPQPAEPVKTLINNQEPLGEEFQRVLDEHSWDLYVKTTEPDEERLAMEAIMESVDPATWLGLTPAQRCALGRFAKPQPAEPVKSWHDFAPRQHQNPDKFAMPVNVVDKSTHKWKRIEEYSKEMDGKKIDIYLGGFLLYCPQFEDEENNGVVIGYYSEPYKGWYTSETLEEVFPTHFMPLPEKPL